VIGLIPGHIPNTFKQSLIQNYGAYPLLGGELPSRRSLAIFCQQNYSRLSFIRSHGRYRPDSLWILPGFALCCYGNYTMFIQLS